MALLTRLLLFAALWWVLVEGELYGLPLAVVVIGAATLASLRLVPAGSWRWRAGGVLRFLPFFLRQSVLGGADVARRAFHPHLPLQPDFVEYPLRLPPGPARIFLANTVSLLPGTLSAELGETALRVHVLDRSLPVHESLREVEERVAAVFGVEVVDRGS